MYQVEILDENGNWHGLKGGLDPFELGTGTFAAKWQAELWLRTGPGKVYDMEWAKYPLRFRIGRSIKD